METISKHPETKLVTPKPKCYWIWWRTPKTTRRAPIIACVTKGRLEKMWVYYLTRLGTWWHRIWKRPKYWTLSLSGSRTGLQGSQVLETVEKDWNKQNTPLAKENQIREYLRKLDIWTVPLTDPKYFSTVLVAWISRAKETVMKCQSLPSIKLASL